MGNSRPSEGDALSKTKRCLMVINGNYEELIVKLVNVAFVNWVHNKPKEINDLFRMPKDDCSNKYLSLTRDERIFFLSNSKCRSSLNQCCSHISKTISRKSFISASWTSTSFIIAEHYQGTLGPILVCPFTKNGRKI